MYYAVIHGRWFGNPDFGRSAGDYPKQASTGGGKKPCSSMPWSESDPFSLRSRFVGGHLGEATPPFEWHRYLNFQRKILILDRKGVALPRQLGWPPFTSMDQDPEACMVILTADPLYYRDEAFL